jgi:hypothetical protein
MGVETHRLYAIPEVRSQSQAEILAKIIYSHRLGMVICTRSRGKERLRDDVTRITYASEVSVF